MSEHDDLSKIRDEKFEKLTTMKTKNLELENLKKQYEDDIIR